VDVLAVQRIDVHGWMMNECATKSIVTKKAHSGTPSLLIMHDSQRTKKLWDMLATILSASKSRQLPTNVPSAQDFLEFFNKKVEAVHKETGQGPATTFLPPTTTTLNCFQLYNEADIAKIITAVPSKSCELDPMPTDILKQFLPVLLPYITKMCNASLREGILPTSQRSAIVTPRLKALILRTYETTD